MLTNVRTSTNASTGRSTTYFNVGNKSFGLQGDHSSPEAQANLWSMFKAGKFEVDIMFEPTERTITKGERTGQTFIAPATVMLQPKIDESVKLLAETFFNTGIDRLVDHKLNVAEGTMPERTSVGDTQLALIEKKLAERKAQREAAALAAAAAINPEAQITATA